MNAFALAFIGAMDNGDPIRFRVTKDPDQQAEGREEHTTIFDKPAKTEVNSSFKPDKSGLSGL